MISTNTDDYYKTENEEAAPAGSRFQSIMKIFSTHQANCKKKVLVVDDEVLFRNACSMVLEDRGYEPLTAANTDEALRLMEDSPADALLLDIDMPEENGLTFLERFKSAYPDIPVVIMTGRGYEDKLMQTALDRHAAAYMSKNIEVESMLATVKRLFKKEEKD